MLTARVVLYLFLKFTIYSTGSLKRHSYKRPLFCYDSTLNITLTDDFARTRKHSWCYYSKKMMGNGIIFCCLGSLLISSNIQKYFWPSKFTCSSNFPSNQQVQVTQAAAVKLLSVNILGMLPQFPLNCFIFSAAWLHFLIAWSAMK